MRCRAKHIVTSGSTPVLTLAEATKLYDRTADRVTVDVIERIS